VSFIFSAAFMANAFSMTGMLILLSLAGESAFAADVGIVQAATLALFYAFSGNARNLILNKNSGVTVQSILNNRIVLLIPLAFIAYWMSSMMANVPPLLATILILRRVIEWFDEIFLSQIERSNVKKTAFEYTLLQAGLLAFSFLWLILKLPYPLFGLFLWALLPLLLSAKFYYLNTPTLSNILKLGISKKVLPHIGSSMIIGLAVYVFRLLIIISTGKSVAGDLFTAFAIGGVLGSVFANAIGPSLALHQKHSLDFKIPTIIKFLLITFPSMGLLLFISSYLKADMFSFTGKSLFFWQATGLSMIAATIMAFAQMIRHRLLLHHQEHDLFGPDVMMNILVIAAVPFGYSLFGLQMMSALYLLSATLAYLFYASYEFGEGLKSGIPVNVVRKLKIAIVIMLFIPVFFQLHGGVFEDKAMIFDTKGQVFLLPIPLSILGCFFGLLFLGNYQQAKLSFTFIFTTFILMTFATILSAGQQAGLEDSKFIFLMQFIIPMFGLVLGQFFHQQRNYLTNLDLEKTLFYILILFVPIQIVCAWTQGFYYLQPNLYIMSIYQHFQYVPVIFVSAYLITFVGLWPLQKFRVYLIALMLFMGIYVVSSLNILAILMFFAGVLVYVLYKNRQAKDRQLVIVSVLAASISLFYWLNLMKPNMDDEVTYLQQKSGQQVQLVNAFSPWSGNLEQRLSCWQYYYEGITKNVKSMLLGHAERPNRVLYPSARNYYLDFVYNFGLLAILPLCGLIFYTLRKQVNVIVVLRRNKKYLNIGTFVLSSVVFFLLIVDNALNVSLRQPYSGIFTFFLWGLLINKLSQTSTKG